MGTIVNPETSISQNKPSKQRVVRCSTLFISGGATTIAAALRVRSVYSGSALMADTAHLWRSFPPAVGPVFSTNDE